MLMDVPSMEQGWVQNKDQVSYLGCPYRNIVALFVLLGIPNANKVALFVLVMHSLRR
jgi:hypothetical protein